MATLLPQGIKYKAMTDGGLAKLPRKCFVKLYFVYRYILNAADVADFRVFGIFIRAGQFIYTKIFVYTAKK